MKISIRMLVLSFMCFMFSIPCFAISPNEIAVGNLRLGITLGEVEKLYGQPTNVWHFNVLID